MNTASSAGRNTALAIAAKIEGHDMSGARALLTTAFVASPRDPDLISLAQRVPNLYAADFYDAQHAGSLASARRILSVLRKHCAFARVCDFGAGLGTWLRAAYELGATQLAAFEGPWALEHPERFGEASCMQQPAFAI